KRSVQTGNISYLLRIATAFSAFLDVNLCPDSRAGAQRLQQAVRTESTQFKKIMGEFDDEEEGAEGSKDFEKNLALFEGMIAGGETHYFDADQMEEIIDYYL